MLIKEIFDFLFVLAILRPFGTGPVRDRPLSCTRNQSLYVLGHNIWGDGFAFHSICFRPSGLTTIMSGDEPSSRTSDNGEPEHEEP